MSEYLKTAVQKADSVHEFLQDHPEDETVDEDEVTDLSTGIISAVKLHNDDLAEGEMNQ